MERNVKPKAIILKTVIFFTLVLKLFLADNALAGSVVRSGIDVYHKVTDIPKGKNNNVKLNERGDCSSNTEFF